jgi:DNA-binding response OmpR family regulator
MRCSVLVVDDERFIVDLIADVLEDEGFSVIRAFDGVQATKAIRRRLPDLVIADIMMPYLDGVTLAQSLQKRDPPIPVILMSAGRREMPAFDGTFLPKPFDLDELVALARKLTGNTPVPATKSASQPRRAATVRRVPAGG